MEVNEKGRSTRLGARGAVVRTARLVDTRRPRRSSSSEESRCGCASALTLGAQRQKGGAGAYSSQSCTDWAASVPQSSAIRISAKSTPAVTPPSRTTRPSSGLAAKAVSMSRQAQWQAGRWPCNRPAASRIREPVQTEVR